MIQKNNDVYIGLGSNMGDPQGNMLEALKRIAAVSELKASSSLYLTEPWGFTDQDPFVNAVARVKTDMDAQSLFNSLQEIEAGMGRFKTFHWGPRVIDLDILIFKDLVLKEDGLIIPHPRMYERVFVMIPLVELDKSYENELNKFSESELATVKLINSLKPGILQKLIPQATSQSI